MGELRGRWWNGKWGHIARRDIWLRRTDAGWEVTAREGNDDKGKTRVWDLPDEATARRLVADLTEPDDALSEGWRELPMSLYER